MTVATDALLRSLHLPGKRAGKAQLIYIERSLTSSKRKRNLMSLQTGIGKAIETCLADDEMYPRMKPGSNPNSYEYS